ncbi:MAG: hypothetical protein QW717_04150 [Candidatus Bathyarchaeia archaeon]
MPIKAVIFDLFDILALGVTILRILLSSSLIGTLFVGYGWRFMLFPNINFKLHIQAIIAEL